MQKNKFKFQRPYGSYVMENILFKISKISFLPKNVTRTFLTASIHNSNRRIVSYFRNFFIDTKYVKFNFPYFPIEVFKQPFANIGKLQAHDLEEWLPRHLLARADSLSLVNGIECRPFFLDRELLNLSSHFLTIKPTSILRSKYLLRKTSAKMYGRKFSKKKKRSFQVPFELWINGYLKSNVIHEIENLHPSIINVLSAKELERVRNWDNPKSKVSSTIIFTLISNSLWLKSL